jgi:hypothetical protein
LTFFDESRHAKIAVIAGIIAWLLSFIFFRGIVKFDLIFGTALFGIILNLLAHYHKEQRGWIVLGWIIIIPPFFCLGALIIYSINMP